MNCETFTSLMGDYRDNDLDAATKTSFEGHLSLCPNCASMFNSYKEAIRTARSLPYGDLSASVMHRIRKDLRARLDNYTEYQ
jgi:anti-sigma factor RsiW